MKRFKIGRIGIYTVKFYNVGLSVLETDNQVHAT